MLANFSSSTPHGISHLFLPRLQNLARRIRSRASRQPRSRMRAVAAEVEIFYGRFVAGSVEERAHGEELVEG